MSLLTSQGKIIRQHLSFIKPYNHQKINNFHINAFNLRI